MFNVQYMFMVSDVLSVSQLQSELSLVVNPQYWSQLGHITKRWRNAIL
jgi:hypothetical protein